MQCNPSDFFEMVDKEIQTLDVEIHALSSVGSDDETADRQTQENKKNEELNKVEAGHLRARHQSANRSNQSMGKAFVKGNVSTFNSTAGL